MIVRNAQTQPSLALQPVMVVWFIRGLWTSSTPQLGYFSSFLGATVSKWLPFLSPASTKLREGDYWITFRPSFLSQMGYFDLVYIGRPVRK